MQHRRHDLEAERKGVVAGEDEMGDTTSKLREIDEQLTALEKDEAAFHLDEGEASCAISCLARTIIRAYPDPLPLLPFFRHATETATMDRINRMMQWCPGWLTYLMLGVGAGDGAIAILTNERPDEVTANGSLNRVTQRAAEKAYRAADKAPQGRQATALEEMSATEDKRLRWQAATQAVASYQRRRIAEQTQRTEALHAGVAADEAVQRAQERVLQAIATARTTSIPPSETLLREMEERSQAALKAAFDMADSIAARRAAYDEATKNAANDTPEGAAARKKLEDTKLALFGATRDEKRKKSSRRSGAGRESSSPLPAKKRTALATSSGKFSSVDQHKQQSSSDTEETCLLCDRAITGIAEACDSCGGGIHQAGDGLASCQPHRLVRVDAHGLVFCRKARCTSTFLSEKEGYERRQEAEREDEKEADAKALRMAQATRKRDSGNFQCCPDTPIPEGSYGHSCKFCGEVVHTPALGIPGCKFSHELQSIICMILRSTARCMTPPATLMFHWGTQVPPSVRWRGNSCATPHAASQDDRQPPLP